MPFIFFPYSDLQIKQYHNAKMIYTSYLETLKSYNLTYRYKILWQKHKDGYELLAKQHLRTGKREYLGRRSAETEKIKADFLQAKVKVKERLKNLKEKMKREEKLNKLEGIARTPKELVAIFRKINELNLDDKLIAIGTNSLYNYEVRSAVFIEQEHLATRDIDLLNRKDKGISFIFNELMSSRHALALLHDIDSSFERSNEAPYRFINADGVWIELINPTSDTVTQASFKDNLFTDVIPLAMTGMQWLENSRLSKATIISENGQCANLTTVHPLEFAIYKNWLSKQEDRDYQKHIRDQQQSKLVTQLMKEYMPNIDIDAELEQMRHFKKEVVLDYIDNILKKDI